jgi:hypothetical protein
MPYSDFDLKRGEPKPVTTSRGVAEPRLALLLCGLLSCAPPAAPARPPDVVVLAATSQPEAGAPAPAPPDPAAVSVTTLRLPKGFALDGDIAEWGSLLPRTGPEPFWSKQTYGTDPDDPPFPPYPRTPPDAPSRIAVALTGDGAFIAADLSAGSKDGVWLGIAFYAPDLPPIGYLNPSDRLGLSVDVNAPRGCDKDLFRLSPALFPDIAACEAAIPAHKKQAAEHAARFLRLFRLDREGLRAVGSGGALTSVDGARATFRERDGHLTIEATLPARALPRAAQAPIDWVRLLASSLAASTPPEAPIDAWIPLDLPDAVGFEPLAELRALAVGPRQRERHRETDDLEEHAISYQPGEPEVIEELRYVDLPGGRGRNGLEVQPYQKPLYAKLRAFGDFEIGEVYSAENTLIAVLRQGKFVEFLPGDSKLVTVVDRGQDLHFVYYGQGHASVRLCCQEGYDFTRDEGLWAGWGVTALHPDGTFDINRCCGLPGDTAWRTVRSFHSPDFRALGLRGEVLFDYESDPGDNLAHGRCEATWRYDTKTDKYRLDVNNSPRPKRNHPRGSPAAGCER